VHLFKLATVRLLGVSVAGAAALAAGACGRHASQAPQKAERSVVWRQLGSWAGRGSLQTESFTSDSGTLRIRWETSSPPDSGSTAELGGGVGGPAARDGAAGVPPSRDASGGAPAGARQSAQTRTVEPGSFHLAAHSAISGRLLQQVVDHTGAGQGVGYVQQEPHVFYVVVESTQLNWRFTVEEAIEYP